MILLINNDSCEVHVSNHKMFTSGHAMHARVTARGLRAPPGGAARETGDRAAHGGRRRGPATQEHRTWRHTNGYM